MVLATSFWGINVRGGGKPLSGDKLTLSGDNHFRPLSSSESPAFTI